MTGYSTCVLESRCAVSVTASHAGTRINTGDGRGVATTVQTQRRWDRGRLITFGIKAAQKPNMPFAHNFAE
jgi:hypothetical protein